MGTKIYSLKLGQRITIKLNNKSKVSAYIISYRKKSSDNSFCVGVVNDPQ